MSMELEQNTSVENPIQKPAPALVQPAPWRPPLDRRDSVWGRVRFFEAFTSLAVVHDDDDNNDDDDDDNDSTALDADDKREASGAFPSPVSAGANGIDGGHKQEPASEQSGHSIFRGAKSGSGRLVVLPSESAAQSQHELAAAGAGSVARPRSWSTQLSAAPSLPLARVDPASDQTARSTRIALPLGYVCNAPPPHTHGFCSPSSDGCGCCLQSYKVGLDGRFNSLFENQAHANPI